jgi:HlyD family secretion protein
LAAAVAVYFAARGRPGALVLTGIVTTDSVIVSSEVQGRLQELRVKEGDTVKKGDVIGLIRPQEWKDDATFYASGEEQSKAGVKEAEAALKYQEAQTLNQTRQAEANLASARAQVTQANADLEIARLNFQRLEDLYQRKVESAQSHDQAKSVYDGANARMDSLRKLVEAAEAGVALAKSSESQISERRAALEGSRNQLAAAVAQNDKAKTRLGYTEIRSPVDGIVNVRSALQGEVVTPGQGIVLLINPDDLWVRADVEESRIDRVRLGEKMRVRLPSGAELDGTVFFRGVDADFATQRDVSRTKRDIKTFEIRLRCDNRDRRLAVGMTAFVAFPLETPPR